MVGGELNGTPGKREGGGGGGRGENARVKELPPFLFSHPFFFLCEL